MNRRLTWEGLGVPEFLLPSPFPYLPIPKGLIMKVEGLKAYTAYSLRDSTVEVLGTVYGADKDEAMEAAENLAEVTGSSYSAVGVMREW